MKIHHVSPEIPRFGVASVDDWFKVHPGTTPQPIPPAQKQAGLVPDAAAQDRSPKRDEGAASTVHPPVAAAPFIPKPGEMVMVYDICMDHHYPAHVLAYIDHPAFGGPGVDVRVIGEDRDSHWKSWRAPTAEELAALAPPEVSGEWRTGKPKKDGMYAIPGRQDCMYATVRNGVWMAGYYSMENAHQFLMIAGDQSKIYRELTAAERAEYSRIVPK